MISQIITSKTVRKICIFAVSFVVAVIAMGGRIATAPDAMNAARQAGDAGEMSLAQPIPTPDTYTDIHPSIVRLGDISPGNVIASDILQAVSNDGSEEEYDNGQAITVHSDYEENDTVIRGYYGNSLENEPVIKGYNNADSEGQYIEIMGERVGFVFDFSEGTYDTDFFANRPAHSVTEPGVYPEGFSYHKEIPLTEELQLHTFVECSENGVDYGLVLAIMWRESRFNADAVNVNSNGTKDNGIMQINDVNKTWIKKELGIENLMDPYQNVSAGTAMLGRLVNKYGEHNALLAYQYGELGMKNKLNQGVTTNKQIQVLYDKRDDFNAIFSK